MGLEFLREHGGRRVREQHEFDLVAADGLHSGRLRLGRNLIDQRPTSWRW